MLKNHKANKVNKILIDCRLFLICLQMECSWKFNVKVFLCLTFVFCIQLKCIMYFENNFLLFWKQLGNMTFHWLEIYNVRNARNLQEEFVDKTADILDDQQVNHGIIFVKDSSSPDQLHRLKESWISHNDKAYIVVNVFDTKSSFDNFYYSGT